MFHPLHYTPPTALNTTYNLLFKLELYGLEFVKKGLKFSILTRQGEARLMDDKLRFQTDAGNAFITSKFHTL